MFESLLSWCKFPVYVHKKTGFSAGGDYLHAAPIEYKCYRVDSMQTITDKFGKEYISNTQVYLPSDYSDVTVEDLISFPDLLDKREIRKIGGFFDGETGTISVAIVYL